MNPGHEPHDLEETKFDTKNVTSIDWMSYPILDITERPAEIDIVLIDRPNVAPSGAGEPSMRPLSAAIANASSTHGRAHPPRAVHAGERAASDVVRLAVEKLQVLGRPRGAGPFNFGLH